MSNEQAPKADGLNCGKILEKCLGAPEGARPVRKRGYRRALKRGEMWALMERANTAMLNNLIRMMYEGTAYSKISWDSATGDVVIVPCERPDDT